MLNCSYFKAIVHSNGNSVIIYSPSSSSKPAWKSLWEQSSSGAPLTSIVFFSYYGSQWCPKTAWLQTFFRISSFVFSKTKIFMQVWNYLSGSKWQNEEWTIPLRHLKIIIIVLPYMSVTVNILLQHFTKTKIEHIWSKSHDIKDEVLCRLFKTILAD